MTGVRAFAAVSVAAALAGCAATGSPRAGPPPPKTFPAGGECRVAPAQFAVGRVADADLQTQAAKRSGARVVRVLRPGQAITMEFNAERLNLEVDASDRVVAARCG